MFFYCNKGGVCVIMGRSGGSWCTAPSYIRTARVHTGQGGLDFYPHVLRVDDVAARRRRGVVVIVVGPVAGVVELVAGVLPLVVALVVVEAIVQWEFGGVGPAVSGAGEQLAPVLRLGVGVVRLRPAPDAVVLVDDGDAEFDGPPPPVGRRGGAGSEAVLERVVPLVEESDPVL